MKVLIVEDDPVYRELLGLALSSAGHETTLAEHGAKALESVKGSLPDVILLDILMPVMDGMRFLRELREGAKLSTPVVVLTCLDSRSFAVQALVEGATDVLTKPVDIEVLLEKLAACAGQHAAVE